jgi:hypothetical protein
MAYQIKDQSLSPHWNEFIEGSVNEMISILLKTPQLVNTERLQQLLSMAFTAGAIAGLKVAKEEMKR